ncbi:MAG: hypothetical protein Ta2B_00410 [Termitinemataceae bacterium]|nr:MAG: hypothetical protein Ta2B_00410 [Termitinemataceae bacterium]
MKTLQELLDIIIDNAKLNNPHSFYEKSSWEMILQKAFMNNKTSAKEIADHSKIFIIENGILTIQVNHPGWMQLLQARQKEIVAIIHQEFPEMNIGSLAFCIV